LNEFEEIISSLLYIVMVIGLKLEKGKLFMAGEGGRQERRVEVCLNL